MLRAYRFEYQDGDHGLWETDLVHIAELEEYVRKMIKGMRQLGHTPSPSLGSEVVDVGNGNPFHLAQRYFPSQAAVDADNEEHHLWLCAKADASYRWLCAHPRFWWNTALPPFRLLVTVEMLRRHRLGTADINAAPYFAPEDWHVRLLAQRCEPYYWSGR
jgi:hypothetical protein